MYSLCYIANIIYIFSVSADKYIRKARFSKDSSTMHLQLPDVTLKFIIKPLKFSDLYMYILSNHIYCHKNLHEKVFSTEYNMQ